MKHNMIPRLYACVLVVVIFASQTTAVEKHEVKRFPNIPSIQYTGSGLIQGTVLRAGAFFGKEKSTQPRQFNTTYESPDIHKVAPNTIFRSKSQLNNRPVYANRPNGNVPYRHGRPNVPKIAVPKSHGNPNIPVKAVQFPTANVNTAYRVHRYNGIQIKPTGPFYIPTITTTTTQAPTIDNQDQNQLKGILSYLGSIKKLLGTESTFETLKAIAKIASNKDGLRFIANFIKSGVISNPEISVQLESLEDEESNKPQTLYEIPSNAYGPPTPQIPTLSYGIPSTVYASPQKPETTFVPPIKTSTSKITGSLISTASAHNYGLPANTYGLPLQIPSKNSDKTQSFELPKVSPAVNFTRSNSPAKEYGPPIKQNSSQVSSEPAPPHIAQSTSETYNSGSLISSKPGQSYNQPTEINNTFSQTYGLPEKVYGFPAQAYQTPSQIYGSPVEIYGAPTQSSAKQTSTPPAQAYGLPFQTYGPPSQPFSSTDQTYGPPAQEFGIHLQENNAPAQKNNTLALVNIDPAQEYNVPDNTLQLKESTDFTKPQGSTVQKPIVIYELPSPYTSSVQLEQDNVFNIPSYDSPITSYGVPISTAPLEDVPTSVKDYSQTTTNLDSLVPLPKLPELPHLSNEFDLLNDSNVQNRFGDSQPIIVKPETNIRTTPVYDLPSKDSVIFTKKSESKTSPEIESQNTNVVNEQAQKSGVIKTTYEAPGYSFTQYKNVDIDNEASSSDIDEAVTTLETVPSDITEKFEDPKTILTAIPLIIEREPAWSSNTNNIMTINRNRKRWQS